MLSALIVRDHNQEIEPIYNAFFPQFGEEYFPWGKIQNTIDARINIGWAKIAITLGLESLRSIKNNIKSNPKFKLDENMFQKQIKYVMSKGGDTDTNAAIVGGMLGALVGFTGLPRNYIQKLMNFRHEKWTQQTKRQIRPKFYEPRVAFSNAFTIIMNKLKSLGGKV